MLRVWLMGVGSVPKSSQITIVGLQLCSSFMIEKV